MIVAGTDGPIVTPIKALLTPNKMQASSKIKCFQLF